MQKQYLVFLFRLNIDQYHNLSISKWRERERFDVAIAPCGLSRTVKIRSGDKIGKGNKQPCS